MNCPQCNGRVPVKTLWSFAGSSAPACPKCKVSLCPRASCAVVMFLLACLAGDGTLILLRRAGAESWLAFGAFFVVFAGIYLVGMRLILRLRVSARPPLIGPDDAAVHRR